jgi:lipopolysaccharide transport system ATP-binding protein
VTTQRGAEGGEMIRVLGLGKKFKLYPRPWGRMTEWLTLGRAVRHDDFWALRDVSFTVRRGESLGVIGVNGSGKSTLLKILSGALYPTEGMFNITGRVLSLLELGTGLNPELTGRQNVINSSRLLAFPPGYASERMPQIEAFAELPDGFFDRPVKLYSSGMLVRLVFSMFACFDPDVFVIDEALSVGDVFFQQKCARRLAEMKAAGVTMLFVSHDLAAVEALCDRVLVLHHGRVEHDGDKKTGIRVYYACGGQGLRREEMPVAAPNMGRATAATQAGRRFEESNGTPEPTPAFPPVSFDELTWHAPDARDALGDGRVEITGVAFRQIDADGRVRNDPVVTQGGWIEVLLRAEARADARAVNLGIGLYDRLNRLLFARGWINAGLPATDLRAGDVAAARCAVKLDLEPDEYILALAAAEALPDPAAPGGWDQNLGGVRYRELPHAAVIAVLPAKGGGRVSFGPANLRSHLEGVVISPAVVQAGAPAGDR